MQDKLQNVQYIYIISEQSASRLQAGTDSNKKIKNIRDKISIAALHMNQNHQWTAIPGKINEAHTGQTVSWESDGREEEAFHDRQEPLRLAKVTAHKPNWTGHATGTRKAM